MEILKTFYNGLMYVVPKLTFETVEKNGMMIDKGLLSIPDKFEKWNKINAEISELYTKGTDEIKEAVNAVLDKADKEFGRRVKCT